MQPELWPYSNYLEWIGERSGQLVDKEFIEARFPRSGQYEQYVEDYLLNRDKLSKALMSLNAYLQELAQ